MAMSVMELVPVYRADQPFEDGKNRYDSSQGAVEMLCIHSFNTRSKSPSDDLDLNDVRTLCHLGRASEQ